MYVIVTVTGETGLELQVSPRITESQEKQAQIYRCITELQSHMRNRLYLIVAYLHEKLAQTSRCIGSYLQSYRRSRPRVAGETQIIIVIGEAGSQLKMFRRIAGL